jgi:hypothetical protein
MPVCTGWQTISWCRAIFHHAHMNSFGVVPDADEFILQYDLCAKQLHVSRVHTLQSSTGSSHPPGNLKTRIKIVGHCGTDKWRGALATKVKLLSCDNEVMGSKSEKQPLVKMQGNITYIRFKVVEPFSRPCVSGSYVHRAALFVKVTNHSRYDK